MAVAITKLQVYPQSVDHFSFNERWRTKLVRRGSLKSAFGVHKGRYGLCMQQCRSFRSEDGGQVDEKKKESEGKQGSLKENEDKLKNGRGFWSALKVAVCGVGGLGSQSNEEHSKAVAKLEEVFSSVSCKSIDR